MLNLCVLQVDSAEWHRWSAEQREAHLKKFRKIKIPYKQAEVVQHISTSQPQSDPPRPCTLSVSADEVQIPGIPEATVQGIWSKGAAIVSKSDAIVNAPGSNDSMLVESKTGKRPHLVSKESAGRFTCDDGCKMWLSTRICAHTVAVADTINLLPSFLDWRKKCKGASVSLAGMVLSDTPKGAGRKGGKQGKKYGKSAAQRVTVQNYSSPFDDCSTPTSSRTPSPSSPFEKPEFFLKWMSRRINVCQGKCERPMRDEQGRMYPPPFDLCLARKERRSYRSPLDGMKKLGKESDCHYHLKRSCVEKADPPYRGEKISIPPEVNVRMSQAHKEALRNEFGQ